MKKRFTEAQIVGFLREADAGIPVKDLCRKHGFGEPIRVDGPDWSVTDSGGDGLAIHRRANELAFRLWESKAHTGTGEVRDVVNKACRPISSHALRTSHASRRLGRVENGPRDVVVNEQAWRLQLGAADRSSKRRRNQFGASRRVRSVSAR